MITIERTALEYLARKRTAAAAAILALLATIPNLSPAQTPTPTPLIYPSPTPTTTATPAKSNISYGDPATFTPRPYDLHVPQGQPSPTPIRSIDQPPAADPQSGETLQWATYAPTTTGPDGTNHWPVIVVFHIGGYKGGDYYQAMNFAPQDLAAAGFYVVCVGVPLAPPGNILGQYDIQQSDPTRSGRYPQQTRAAEAFIDAARNDPNCYQHRVGVLGGSCGASHAMYVALDVTSTSGVWPFWHVLQRPLCAVGLSGQYDFSDRDTDIDLQFITNIENYTYTTNPLEQWLHSPIGLIAGVGASGFIPMYCIRASDDPGSPKSNSDYFWYAMTQAGASAPTFFMETVPISTDHAFGLWGDYLDDNQLLNPTVRDRVIAFFKQYLYN
jgi:acetyl esterase/lipase